MAKVKLTSFFNNTENTQGEKKMEEREMYLGFGIRKGDTKAKEELDKKYEEYRDWVIDRGDEAQKRNIDSLEDSGFLDALREGQKKQMESDPLWQLVNATLDHIDEPK